MGTILPVESDQATPALLHQTSRILRAGGCLVIPTFGLYGMAANAFDERAVRRLFAIKERPLTNPILLLIQDQDAVNTLVTHIPAAATALMEHLWPGKLTLVFEAAPCIPEIITAGTGKVGLRVPAHPVTRAITGAVPFPITGTSANISRDPGVSTVKALNPRIIEGADLIIDAGQLKGDTGSTVVDVTCTPPRILRQGSTPARDIFTILGISL